MGKWIKNWFSNMLPFDEPLTYEGIVYRTVENFFQAMKTNNRTLRTHIASLDPFVAKKFSQKLTPNTVRPNWRKIKLKVMEYALRHKFKKGTSWHNKLMQTGNEEIVEWNNWNDLFWGKSVHTKQGENHLGKLLMKIRDEYADRENLK
jgi:ribA/ribD-fused uncharacterized protein